MSDRLLVRSMTLESDGVLSVELVDPSGRELPAWEPGAHLDVHADRGLSRQYSLSGDPHDRYRYRLGVLREPAGRGGSAYVHETLRPGRRRRSPVRATTSGWSRRRRTSSSPAASGSRRSCRWWRAPRRRAPSWTLLYGGRTASSMAFTGELAAYGERVTVHPQDTHGLLDLDSLLGTPRPDTLVYVLRSGGVADGGRGADGRLAGGLAAPGAVRRPRGAGAGRRGRARGRGGAGRVRALGDGRSGDVHPRRPSLDDGVDVLHDCQEGICGSCETKVIEGEVDHRDYVLTDREKAANDCMMVCVSRACGKRLVLGL